MFKKFNNKFNEINSDFSVLLEESFRKEFLGNAISKFGSQAKLAEYLNSKIDNKNVIRESIKNWLKGKHIYGWDILIPIGVLKELCLLNSYNLEEALDKAIKFNPPWKDPKNAQFLIKPKEYKVLESDNKFYLDLATALPKESLESQRARKKLPLFAEVSENKVRLWSEASWNKSKIKLKRFLELNNDLFLGLAIFVSEGTTKVDENSYNGSISLGNSEPCIINVFLKWLDSFLIDYKISCGIEYNGKSFNETVLKAFWNNQIKRGICSMNIISRPEHGTNLLRNFGTLNVRINITVLKPSILHLSNILKNIIFGNKDWCIAYLKGLVASEGSVNVGNGVLKDVSIGAIKPAEREFIKKLLKKLNLNCFEGNTGIIISDWKSFYNLFEYDAFEMQQVNSYSKKERFLYGFRNHRKTQKLIRLLPFKKREFTAYDWQNYYNLKFYISSHNYLNPLIKGRILKSTIRNNKKYFYLNSDKLKELEIIWNL